MKINSYIIMINNAWKINFTYYNTCIVTLQYEKKKNLKISVI